MIAIFVWRGAFKKSGPQEITNLSSPEILNPPAVQNRDRPRSSSVDWGRNPFVLESVASGSQILALSGILWDAENPKAIIGDKIVGKGDKIEEKTVIDIQKDRVILNDGVKDFELILGQ